MNIVVFHGSARRDGDTDTLAHHFIQGMETQGSHPITHFRPIEMTIAHCRACLQCSTGNGCVIDDDMQAVYPALRAADVVVLATPMFWGYMTSQLKALFDRLEAVVSEAYFGRKDFVLLLGYRHYYGSMIEWMERITKGFGSQCHALACRTYDPETGCDLRIQDLPDALAAAFDLGQRIAASA